MKVFKLCNEYLLKYKYRLCLYFIICIVISFISICSPYIMAGFIDNLIYHGNLKVIYGYCVLLVALNIVKLLLCYIQAILNTKLQMNAAYYLNKYAIFHVQNMSVSYIDNTEVAYLHQIINGDANTLISFCLTVIQNIISFFVALVIPLIIMCSIDIGLTIILVVLLMIYTITFSIVKKPLYRSAYNLSEAKSHFAVKFLEQLSLLKYIKLNAIQKELSERLDSQYEDVLKVTIHNQKVNFSFVALDTAASTIAQIFLFCYGGLSILNKRFTVGKFTMFSSYFSMMMSSVKYFINLRKLYQEVLVSYDRLTRILKYEEETNGEIVLKNIKQIEIKNLYFSYGNILLFERQNLKLEVGNLYCFYGKNGSGKTTMLNLLCGLYIDEYQGEILYNDINIKLLDMRTIRKNLMGISEQEPNLLLGSIKFNLFFDDNAEYDGEYLDSLSRLLGLEDYLSKLCDNIYSQINDNCNNISGGEKQKLSILRVLLKEPSVLILDEPTSAMDYESARRFIAYLDSIKKDKIIIIVTHDQEIKYSCDKIIDF